MSAVFDLADWQRRGPDPFPPPWASSWGDDRYGVWAELRVASEVQRQRWNEPGHFRMGDESQPEQQVPTTIASGFWLADSACTQALWQAVMGSNPSHFSERNSKPGSPQHPVEQVSWNDVVLLPAGAGLAAPPELARLAGAVGAAVCPWPGHNDFFHGRGTAGAKQRHPGAVHHHA